MSTIHIDAATEADIPTILALVTALAEYERLADAVVATEDSLRASLFGHSSGRPSGGVGPDAEVVIARVGTEPVGFAAWFYNYSTFLGRRGLYLEDLFVLPPWRGKGIGRALLTHLARLAVAEGCGRMEWSVLDWNEPAVGFYKSLGAQPMNDWTVFRLTGPALTALGTGGGAPKHPRTKAP